MKVLTMVYVLSIFIHISRQDMRRMEIPDYCHILLLLLYPFSSRISWSICLINAVLFIIPVYFRWMGMGDWKLIVVWSLLQGMDVYPGLWLASTFALIYGRIKKKACKQRFPFGPFLVAGFYIILCLRLSGCQW